MALVSGVRVSGGSRPESKERFDAETAELLRDARLCSGLLANAVRISRFRADVSSVELRRRVEDLGLSAEERGFLRGMPEGESEADFVASRLYKAVRGLGRRAGSEDAGKAMEALFFVDGQLSRFWMDTGMLTQERFAEVLDPIPRAVRESVSALGARARSPEAWAMAVEFFSGNGGESASAARALGGIARNSDFGIARQGALILIEGGKRLPAAVGDVLVERALERGDREFAARVKASQFVRAV
jgi:hypothetical protein